MQGNVFERHPAPTLAVVILLLVSSTDVAFTYLYRKLAATKAPPPSAVRVRADPYHHGLRPMARNDHEQWGPVVYPYRTNSLGLRDRDTREVALASEKPRLVLMGDSFTEGVGVPYEKTFAGIVESALAPAGVEVLNAGLSFSSPIIYERKTRALLDAGLRFDEMVVFLDISDIQDELTFSLDARGNVAIDTQRRRREEKANERYEEGPPWVTRVQHALDAHTIAGARIFAFLRRPFRSRWHRGAAWTFDASAFEEFGREGLSRAERHMDALHQLLRARGIPLTVVVYPWADQIVRGDRDSRQSRAWHEWAGARGAGFIDLFPAFFAAAPDPDAAVRQYFIPGDVHWNEAGHALVAEAFLRAYDTRPARGLQ